MGQPSALMVTSSFLPGMGGIESYLAELCAELAPRVAVWAPARRDGKPLPRDLPYPAYGYGGSMLVPGRGAARSIVAHARLLGTDRVLFGTPWPLLLLGPSLRRAGLRYAAIVHGAELLVPGAVPALSKRLAEALAGAELLLPVSGFTGEAIRSLLARHRLPVPPVEVLRARVDLERFRPDVVTVGLRERLGVPVGARVVLAFGRLVKRKGVHRLVDLAPELARRVPHAVVVVAGMGPEKRSLERRAERTGAPVIFAGRVPDADAPALYAVADVFCLPVADRFFGLEAEGLGVVLLEAMACGTPAVTGRSGGTPEAVLDGETGLVVDATDQSALTDALVALLNDAEVAERMGRAGREHVRRAFSERPLPDGLVRWIGEGVR
ncbi:MAG TPA: glycosyltransferase family 4 protein [Actinomycetota bacterium]|nr:glycosyltransferase family 4 protein [Actinomycetota bacterium]